MALERAVREAVDVLDLDASVQKVEDYPTIMGYGVMSLGSMAPLGPDREVSDARQLQQP